MRGYGHDSPMSLCSYVEWSSHEPEEGSFDFEGQQNIVRFLKLAQKQDLLVLLRPGPYIDAERDMVGTDCLTP